MTGNDIISEPLPAQNPLQIDIECFEGPLELLLYLIRVQEVDIWEVSLSEICDRYMEILERSKGSDIELGGEFLVIAATLLEIKSARVLPYESDEDEEVGSDPREELIRQVLAYRECRNYAIILRELENKASTKHPRGYFEKLKGRITPDQRRYDAYVIFNAYQKLLEQIYARSPRIIRLQNKGTEYFRNNVLKSLKAGQANSFYTLFSKGADRIEVISTFLALLELSKEGIVKIYQGSTFGSIKFAPTKARDN